MTTDPVSLADDVIESWQSLVDTMALVLNVPAGLIMRLSGDQIEVLISSRSEGNPYHPGDSEHFLDSGLYCETVIRTQTRLLIPDALADPDWRDNPDVKLGMISYLGLPINLPDGSPFGTICVLDSKANSYSELYVRLLFQFKSVVETHLHLAVMNGRLDRKNRELQSALEKVETLEQIIPVCVKCKKVRDDEGFWSRIESYLAKHRNLEVTHSYCPECAEEWEAEIEREWQEGP